MSRTGYSIRACAGDVMSSLRSLQKTPPGIVQPQAIVEPASVGRSDLAVDARAPPLLPHPACDNRPRRWCSCCSSLAYRSPYVVTWQYNELDYEAFLSPPSADHWFGTTQNGFDMFALTMRGMQKSLIIGLLGALISTSLAAVMGSFAGYFGGKLNTVLLVMVDLLLVLPAFLIIAILSPAFRGRTWLLFVVLLVDLSLDGDRAHRARDDACR